MKDIRILQGNRIAPVMETAFAIYGSREIKSYLKPCFLKL